MDKPFGDKLKDLREDRNKTISEMARDIGFDRRSIYNWETGKHVPRHIQTIKIIANYFGVPEEYFYSSDNNSSNRLMKLLCMQDIEKRLSNLEKIVNRKYDINL